MELPIMKTISYYGIANYEKIFDYAIAHYKNNLEIWNCSL